eukprot:SAG11_NODE_796_length_7130_cov_57.915375_5_plen_190_part_00
MSNNNIISKWRYHRPKNVASLAGHMSALTPLGAPSFDTHDETDKYCAAHCLTIYMQRTDHLSREPVYVEDDQGYFPFFLALSTNKSKNHEGIKAATIAKDILWIMQLSGIDTAYFKAHVVRHASLAAKRDFGMERDTFLACAKMSSQVYDKYYNVPIVREHARTDEVRRSHAERQYGQLGERSTLAICD